MLFASGFKEAAAYQPLEHLVGLVTEGGLLLEAKPQDEQDIVVCEADEPLACRRAAVFGILVVGSQPTHRLSPKGATRERGFVGEGVGTGGEGLGAGGVLDGLGDRLRKSLARDAHREPCRFVGRIGALGLGFHSFYRVIYSILTMIVPPSSICDILLTTYGYLRVLLTRNRTVTAEQTSVSL